MISVRSRLARLHRLRALGAQSLLPTLPVDLARRAWEAAPELGSLSNVRALLDAVLDRPVADGLPPPLLAVLAHLHGVEPRYFLDPGVADAVDRSLITAALWLAGVRGEVRVCRSGGAVIDDGDVLLAVLEAVHDRRRERGTWGPGSES